MRSSRGVVVIALALARAIAGGVEPEGGPQSVFTALPLDLNQIREISPLGNLNPVGGHVFPTDHMYLDYGAQSGIKVVAPAAGTVTAVRDQSGGDLKIEIRANENISYYLAHLYLDSGITTGSKVIAGQKLGIASRKSMLDFGASDARVQLAGFINPVRYPQPTIQAVSPLALFSEPLKPQLYAKVTRKGAGKDGKIDLDRTGRLVGNWFHATLSVKDSSRGDPEVWAKQLSFAYDVRDPRLVCISIGGTIAPAGLYVTPSGAPDPADVSVDTGLVKYQLTRPSRNRLGHDAPGVGVLLIRLITERKLKIEYFAGAHPDDIIDFDQQASIYER